MKILSNIEVPTGNILIVEGEYGKLEMLSIGDYGKNVNIKCDALGLSRIPSRVEHTKMLPLSEKWVITISTQYGCSMGCTFCDVPKVGPGRNTTLTDLTDQILVALQMHPEVRTTKRLNVHFARMGEPTWNPNVLECSMWLKQLIDGRYKVHPVVSTMMPRYNRKLESFIQKWISIKNYIYDGNAGLQLSINSTNDSERHIMFDGNACSLQEMSEIIGVRGPYGRKFTLNFAVAHWEIDPDKLLRWFSPNDYIIKLTPMHKTHTAERNFISTDGVYTEYHPYRNHEEKLKAAGYDVLVFIASDEEDTSRITCGNALLSDTEI